jgi:hypothetical protein
MRRALLLLVLVVAATAAAPATAHRGEPGWRHYHKPQCAKHRTCALASTARERRLYRIQHHKLVTIKPYREWLRSTGDCENAHYGGAPLREGLDAYNPSPFYGRYQFVWSTWTSVGGRGDPRAAHWLEQAFRAVLVLLRDGPGAWPVCGR